MWKRDITLAQLNAMSEGNMLGHVGLCFTALTPTTLEATLPVDARTKQPFGLLHGGASVVLAETLGSVAGYLSTQGEQKVVGVEVNANHLRSAKAGHVRGVCTAIKAGSRQQVWSIEIFDDENQLCCISRLTTAVI